MVNVDELIDLFHSMDDEAQEFTIATARERARRFPRKRPPLRLVLTQAGNGAALGGELGGVLDFDPPPVG
jgi:hypothetical protein